MDDEKHILQQLAVNGMAESGTLVENIDVPQEAIRESIASLKQDGLIEENGFLYLTPDGDEALNELCQERFSSEQLDQLEGLFESFASFDSEFKELAVEWQNAEDGSDDAADKIAALEAFHHRFVNELSELDDRTRAEYEWYVDNLSDALAKVMDGDTAYFTGSEVASYHDLWFALHEDLLRTLGKERAE